MRRDDEKHLDVDELLKQAFPDDLPAEAGERMAFQLSRFRREWDTPGEAKDVRSFPSRHWSPALARVSLAAASILLIILGLILGPSGASSGLASSLATLQKAASVSGQVGSEQTMVCTVQLDKPGANSPRFVIQWISPEETRVRMILAGEEIIRTIRPPREDGSVLAFMAKDRRKETSAQPQLEEELLPVEDLLTPSRLRRFLQGRWRPAGVERMDGCDWESFSISKNAGAAPSRVTVDTCTFLPVKLEKELDKGGKIEAVFRWAPRSEPGTVSRTVPS
jgi:hypothetical protein